MNKYDIRNALYNEIGEILKKEQEYRSNSYKSIMYNEIVNQLDTNDYKNINFMSLSMQLLEIYGEKQANKIMEKIIGYTTKLCQLEDHDLKDTDDYLDTLEKYDILFDTINNEFLTICNRNVYLKNTLKNERSLKKVYQQLLNKFKYKSLITEEDMLNIEILMEKNEVDIDNIIKVKEFIRKHNSLLKNPNFVYSNTIIFMLNDNNSKIEIDEKEERKYGEKLSNVAISYYSSTLKYDKNYIELLRELKDQYDIKEYLYILKKIVSLLVDDLQENINEMKVIYDDEELRKVTIQSYHELNSKIYVVKNIYRDTLKEYKEALKDLQDSTKIDEQEEIFEEKTNIYYLAKGEETCLEKDLKSNIREEKYEEVLKLLNDKKYNTLKYDEDKQLLYNDKFKQFRELRGDQTRIIYHNLNGNNILVIGAMIKKDDNDRASYNSIICRLSQDDLKYYNDNLKNINNEEIEDRIIKFIEDNKRKGTR